MSSTAVLIPARLESSRFPGKALAPIDGTPMVVLCAQNALLSGLPTFICSDSHLISKTCELYGINHILTPSFNTGTDRVNWASNQLSYNYIINLQGDEPLINASAIKTLGDSIILYDNQSLSVVNGLSSLPENRAFDPNNVKAVLSTENKILFFL